MDKLDMQADKLLLKMRMFIHENYSYACPDYDKGCPVCRVWKAYKSFAKALADNGINVKEAIDA